MTTDTNINPRTAALIVAAGRGARFGADQPKQYADLAGRPVLTRTLARFLDHPGVHAVRTVIHADDRALYDAAAAELGGNLLAPVNGGAERQDSVRLGLESLAAESPAFDIVLIHDAARPFVSAEDISAVIEAAAVDGAAVSALPAADTLKREAADAPGQIEATVPREGLWRALTPQGFRFQDILAAHRAAEGRNLTDDAAAAEAHGLAVRLVPGSPANVKITTLRDLEAAAMTMPEEIRTGAGYDVHSFEPGDAVTLCGVKIPHTARLKGHSDADAGLHAVCDALYGALGEGDIGRRFPPTDPQWKGAPSKVFLEDARECVRAAGGRVINIDVTLICEAPKIAPHAEAMRAFIAECLEIEPRRVNIKATTTEKLGFTGRGEGVAAQAQAAVALPAG
ncbi:MAG: bifunctional 2-C-methyl-D-erythritol 4-phosphate cytidylyltransferase/2-C-methyl-D-erythritol 2,4-cyclodiphosphate synthase [Rhodospirillales bacterium]